MEQAYPIAAIGGVALWTLTAFIGGRAEPWDAGLYWVASYPLALLAALVLGYFFPSRPWRWALVLIFSQLPVLLVSGASFGLLPLGIIMLAFLSLPALALAAFGARARRWAG